MTKNLKILVAGAMVLGASVAMADCNINSTLGLTGEGDECCVYNYDENIVSGYLLDYNKTIGDGNTTIKCQLKPEKTKGKKEDRPANEIYSTDADHTGEVCNTLDADSVAVVTGVWANVVSSAGITSLVCEYSPPAQSTGTAYYIDSAVSGVNYTCGSVVGITGEDGSFIFEVGSSCTFYLGDIELRSVDEGSLEDEGAVYETDVEIARILQSLDSDGNPDNGITLDQNIITAMVEAGITELPDTPEEMDAILKVAGVETVVTEEEARNHLSSTLTELIVGKTVYSSCNGELTEMTFGADGVISGNGGGEEFTVGYRIDGAVLYTLEIDDQGMEYDKPHTIIEATSTFFKFDEGNGHTSTFYFTETYAQANPSTECGGDDGGVPANDLVSGTVIFDGHDTASPVISTDGAWIRISPTSFTGGNGIHCKIASDGSFGNSNCFIHWDEEEVLAAFALEGATFTYGISRDSNDNQMWDCDEDYFGGSPNGLTLAEITATPIVVLADFYDNTRTCP